MVLKTTLQKIIDTQQQHLENKTVTRKLLSEIDLKSNHVIVISGIRRCGKSTLLQQLMTKIDNPFYFNFEDQRVMDFSVNDFEKLDEIFLDKSKKGTYFFDEIQNILGWERFIRKKQDQKSKFIVTGSNSSLLSKELGTKLTGRHLRYELLPFSYIEMLKFVGATPSLNSFKIYFEKGGFPEYLRFNKIEMLQELFNDVIARDIVVRYGLREARILKEIAIFLLTNSGKLFTFNKIKESFKLGSTNTTSSYISYFEDSYLLFTIPKFDYSYKKQLVNPKKVYSIDVGLSRAISASFSEDKGRVLENIVFLGLRRKYKEIFYFKEKSECDFLVRDKNKIILAIQVCWELDEDNLEREKSGLKEAMAKFKLKKGLILTFNQEDHFDNILVTPVWRWLSK